MSEFVAELRGDARAAADRLAKALEELPGSGYATRRLTGEVQFPRVVMWRNRGRMRMRGAALRGPLARFEGSIAPSEGGAVLDGSVLVSVPPLFPVPVLVMMSLAMFLSLSGGWRTFATATAFCGILLAAVAYAGRRFAQSTAGAEAELLVQEIRDLIDELQTPSDET